MLPRRKKPELTILEMKVIKIDSRIEVDMMIGEIRSKMMVSEGLGLIHNTSEQILEEKDGSEMTRDMGEEADQGSSSSSSSREIAQDLIVDQDEIVDQEVNSEIEVSPWTDRRAN